MLIFYKRYCGNKTNSDHSNMNKIYDKQHVDNSKKNNKKLINSKAIKVPKEKNKF